MQKKILGEMFYYLIPSKVYSFSALMSFYTIKIIVKMLICEISCLYINIHVTYMLPVFGAVLCVCMKQWCSVVAAVPAVVSASGPAAADDCGTAPL